MTPQELAKVREKFPVGSAVARLSCPLENHPTNASPLARAMAGTYEKRKSTDEDKLNKLERAYLRYLRALNFPWIGIQNVTLKLAHDCRLTVDFVVLDSNGALTFTDVKGFQREDALIKMKVAARMFPHWIFRIAKRNENGCWQEESVKP